MRKLLHAVLFSTAVLALSAGCGQSGSSTGPIAESQSLPGACVCFDGSMNFRSCVVTKDLQTCRQTVTTCNPFFYTNSDCSQWCPSSPQRCP